ncbi:MAG: NUDIX domain-containing protein [Salinarimonas sp.]
MNPLLRIPLHLYWRLTRGMTLGVRALAFDEQKRVFLVRHTYLAGWHLPGGGVETGETVFDALERELREEASLEIRENPEFLGLLHNIGTSARDHVALFAITKTAPVDSPRPAFEIAERGFFALDALPETIAPASLRRIEEWRAGKKPPAHW